MRKLTSLTLALVFIICAIPTPSAGYSVLTHEEIVDLLWLDQIRPMILQRYPNTTTDQLRQAHAYAYGGCLLQDMGYYPYGNKLFSDLVHYVRSGDFVINLLNESHDINEYAFALGALAHYTSDITGHPAVNRSVAQQFPKLQKKYGNEVTYEESPSAHIQTEFGFDVVQIAKQRYTSDAYHDFIGFEVSKPVLERAFRDTYGLELADIFGDVDKSIGSFRHAVSTLIPKMTKVALATHKVQLVKENPNFTKQKFLYNLSRAEYQKNWGTNYQQPGMGTKILAWIIKVIPKFGPLRALDIKTPDARTENLYLKSVNNTVDQYRNYLGNVRAGTLRLPNADLDTGKTTEPGEYNLTDDTYAKLLDKLADKKYSSLNPSLQANILWFYQNPQSPTDEKKRKNWDKTLKALAELKQQPGASSDFLK
jgi:hypothetical protein